MCDISDLAMALDHLSLAAVGEGLGTCWIGGIKERAMGTLQGFSALPRHMVITQVHTIRFHTDELIHFIAASSLSNVAKRSVRRSSSISKKV